MKIVIEFMLWEVKPDGTVEMMSLKVSAVPSEKIRETKDGEISNAI